MITRLERSFKVELIKQISGIRSITFYKGYNSGKVYAGEKMGTQ